MGVRALGKPNNGDERDEKKTGAQNSNSVGGRWRVRLLVVTLNREEIVAVPHGLDENERAVEHQRHKPGENELRRAVQRAEFACREVWKNQSEASQRGQHRQRGARSLDLKSLFVMTGTAREQTGADDAIAYNHDGGENRVARQSCLFGWSRNHDRDNQCRLNDRYGEREDKRAKWLADAVCNHLRVVHGREHSASRATPATAAMSPPLPRKDVTNRITQANTGHVHVHQGVCTATMLMSPLLVQRAAEAGYGDGHGEQGQTQQDQ